MASLTLEGIAKDYDDGTAAVSDFSLEVRDGEFIVLVGPSGCGKTTVLRTVAGLTHPSRGGIRIGSREVTELPPKERDVAMVFQNYALYPHMTVRANMAFGLKMRGYDRAEIDRRVTETSRLLGLSDLLDRRPAALSGGQLQRAAVGRALVRSPSVFLFDEPLSNLDAELRTQLRTEIKRLHRRLKATMVYVTHDQAEAMTLADRMVVMRNGEIRQVGRPLDVYRRPSERFVGCFVGSPAMNVFRGRIRLKDGPAFEADKVRTPLDSDRFDVRALSEGMEVDLGIRPEDLRPEAPDAPADGGARLEGTVDLVEPMGSELHVHIRVAGTPAVARVSAQDRPTPDARLRFGARPSSLHLFEAGTGRSLATA